MVCAFRQGEELDMREKIDRKTVALVAMIVASVVIVAAYEIINNGGTDSDALTVTYDVEGQSQSRELGDDGTATPPDVPEREGYVFDGWYTDPDLTEKFDFRESVTKSFTLYGVFVIADKFDVYTISFDSCGGSDVAPQEVRTSRTPTYVTPERAGYMFVGWFKNEYQAQNYANHQEFDFRVPIYNDWKLYAAWARDPGVGQVTAVFCYNHDDRTEERTVYEGEKVPKPADPRRDNCTFTGWYADEALTVPWDFGTAVKGSDASGGYLYLYAGWKSTVFDRYDPKVVSDEPVYVFQYTDADGGRVYHIYFRAYATDVILSTLVQPERHNPGSSVSYRVMEVTGDTVTECVTKTESHGSSETETKSANEALGKVLDTAGTAADVLSAAATVFKWNPVVSLGADIASMVLKGGSLMTSLMPGSTKTVTTWDSYSESFSHSNATSMFDAVSTTVTQSFDGVDRDAYIGYFIVGNVEYYQIEEYTLGGTYVGSTVVYNTKDCETRWVQLEDRDYSSGLVSVSPMDRYDVLKDHAAYLDGIRGKGSGTSSEPYTVVDTADLEKVRAYPNACFEMFADIDMDGVRWDPIAMFNGTFEGNGHVISGMSLDLSGRLFSQDMDCGLFGIVGQGATVKDLMMKDAKAALPANHEGKGQLDIGILCGENRGLLTGITVMDAGMDINRNQACVGGVVGRNLGTVSSCEVIHLYMFTNGDSGGIAGYSAGRIAGCTVSGDGSSRTMITYYGAVNSRSVGGIAGFDDGGEIEQCQVLNTHLEYTGDSKLEPRLGYLVGHQRAGKILSCGCDRDQDVENRSDYQASAHKGRYVMGTWYAGRVDGDPTVR